MRDEKVVAKGKGELVTYWLEVKSDSSGEKSTRGSDTGSERFCTNIDLDDKIVLLLEKKNRLIDWNTDILRQLLQKIIANRSVTSTVLKSKHKDDGAYADGVDLVTSTYSKPFDEVKEIIALPQEKKIIYEQDDSMIIVSRDVLNQLSAYVSCIASLYKNNEFHNFEHVSEHPPTKMFQHFIPANLTFCYFAILSSYRHHM